MEERRGRGLGRDPAPGPRDPEKFCSAADPAQSTEREGQQSSHKDAGLVSVSGEEVLLTERGTQQTAGTMEPPSGPASRRHVPWSRLLLAGERGQFSGRVWRLENESLAGPWGRRGSERGQGVLFRPEGRGQRTRGGRGLGHRRFCMS